MAVYTVDAALTASDPANNQFKTIQEAIDAARGADPQSEADRITIEIKASAVEYTGVNVAGMSNSVLNLKDAKFITLAGAGAGNTVFRGQINVANSEGVIIENMTITADGTNSAEFVGNGLIDARQQGVKDLIIRNNVIALENCDHASAVKYDVIDLYTQTGSKENVTISGNTISGGCYSIRLDRFNNGATVIADNVITGSQRAINVDGMTGTVEITGNSISNVLHKGIQIAGTAAESVTISENTIQIIGKDDGSAALVYHESLNTTSGFAVTDNSLTVTTHGMPVIMEEGSVVTPTQTNNYMQNTDRSLAEGSAEPETSVAEFLVSADWNGIASGGVVSYNGKFYTIGTNAFGSLNDASAKGADVEIVLVGDKPILADSVDVKGNVTLSGNAVIQRNNANFLIGYRNGDGKLTIAEGSVLDFTNNGTETDGQGIIVSDGRTENGVTDRYHGELFIDNAYVKASYFLNRNIAVISGDGVTVSDTANFSSSNGFYIGSRPESETGDTNVATVTINKKAFVDASGTNGVLVGYEGAGALVVNDAKFVADRQNIDVASGSQIQIVDAEFTARSIANNGTVNVTGNSKLNIESLTGNVNLVDGANLSDSVIGSGTVVTTGNVTLSGNVKLDKFNAVDGEGEAGNSVIIAAGADVRLNGEVRIRTNEDVHIYGALTVGDAAQFFKKNGTEMTIHTDGVLTLEDSSFQNNGLLTVYGEMNLNYVDGWAPKLAGNETGKYNGQLVVDGKDGKGIVNVKAPFLTFGGGLGSAWKEADDGCTVDILNNGKIVTDAKAFWNSSKNTLTLNHGSLIFDAANSAYDSVWQADAKFDNDGVMSGSNSSVIDMSGRTFTNNGSVTLADSTLTAGTLVNNNIVNVSGNSKISAAVTGELSIKDGAVLATDGLTGTGHLVIDEGATATLSGNGFDFNGYIYGATNKYNQEGVTGFTLNIENAENFSNSALYASNGSRYNLMNSKVETTTLNVNATGKVSVDKDSSVSAETAHILGALETSGELVVDIFNIYAGLDADDAAGQVSLKNGSVATVYRQLNIGTSNRSDAKYNATATGADEKIAKLDLDNATLKFVAIFGEVPHFYVGSDSSAGQLTATESSIELGENQAVDFKVGTQGTVVLSDTSFTLLRNSTFTNNGTITTDYASTITVGGTFTNSGTITVDMAGAAANGVYKLIDNTGTTTMTLADYGTVTAVNNTLGYTFSVINNDLYALNADMTTLKVDATWAGSEFGAEVAEGYYYGINAFSDLKTAALSEGFSTIDVAVGTYATEEVTFTRSATLNAVGTGGVELLSTASSTTQRNYSVMGFGSETETPTYYDAATAQHFVLNGGFVTGHFMTHKYSNVDLLLDGSLGVYGSAYVKAGTQMTVVEGASMQKLSGEFMTDGQLCVYGKLTVNGELSYHSYAMGAVLVVGNDKYGQTAVLTVSGSKAVADFTSQKLDGYQTTALPATVASSGRLVVNNGATFRMNGEIKNLGSVEMSEANAELGKLSNLSETAVMSFSDMRSLTAGAIENLGTFTLTGSSMTLSGQYEYWPHGYTSVGDTEMRDYDYTIDNKGMLNIENSSVTINGSLTNSGTINMDSSEFGASGNIINNGVINVTGSGILSAAVAKGKLNFGTAQEKVNTTYDVTNQGAGEVSVQNGEVTFTGIMADDSTRIQPLNVGRYDINYAGGILNIGSAADKTASVNAHQVYIAENESVNEHTLNVYGDLDVLTSIYNKAKGNLNVYGTVSADYMQVAGKTAVTGADAGLTLAGTGSNGAFKIGTDVSGLRGQMVISDHATVDAGGIAYVGYSDGTRVGDLMLSDHARLNAAAISIDAGSTVVMDYTSTVAFETITNHGTITVDTAGFSSGVYKIFDDLTGSYTETEYGSLLGDANWNKSYQVIDHDLYLTNLEGAELYVDSAWASKSPNEEVTFVDGTKAYYKLNAFDTVANALALPPDKTAYENAVKLNITGSTGAITVIGANITEVNSSAKTADENAVIAEDALTVNLVQVDNANAGWQVYYPLAGGSAASVYGSITTNFVSNKFTQDPRTSDPNFIGGAYAGATAKVYGNTTVNIGETGASDDALMLNTSFLVGAGAGTVNGDSSVNIMSGTVLADAVVGGGAWGGQIKGNSSVIISGGVVTVGSSYGYQAIYGGSYGYNNGGTAATALDSKIEIKGDAKVTGKLVGGSRITNVANASVSIMDTASVTGNIFGGGSLGGQVSGNTSVTVSGNAVVTGNIFGGGDSAGSSVGGDSLISVAGGTVNGEIYAGGYNAGAGNTSIDITGGSVSGNIYGGSFVDASSSTVNSVGDVEIKIENLSASGSRVFGGGKTLKNGVLEADMTEGDAVINIMDNVTLKSVHGGTWVRNYTSDDAQTASQAKAFVKSSNITIDGASSTVSKVFGGGMTSGNGTGALSTVGSSTINLKNGSVGELYGGGWANYFHSTAIGSEDGTATDDTLVRINISGGSADYVYGGGLADVADFSADGDGGGRDTSVNGSVEINISGGSVGEVYGGGFANSWSTYDERFKSPSSTVTGNVAINISGGTVTGDVYGGGNTYNIDSENVNVTSVVNGNVTVTITGGTVSGDIYGGGKEEATVNGSRTLNLGSADAAAYAATLNNVYDFNVAQIVNADVTVTGDFSVEEITIAGATLTLNSGFLAATTAVTIEVGAYNMAAAALNVGVSSVNQPSITISAAEELTAGRYLVASGFDSLSGFTVDGINGYTLRLQGEDVYLTKDLAPDDYDANGRPDILMLHDIGKLQVGLVQEDQSVTMKDVADLGDGWTILGSGQSGNGENYADIYLTNGETVGIWQLDETTGVAAWQEIQSFDSATHVLGLGDFNGDGITDLLLQNDNGAVGAYLTDGENVGWNYFQSLGSEWSIAGIGDFNHDGIDDVVLQNEKGGYAGIWQLDRNGQVSWSDLDVLNNGQIAGTGDFNGDGFDDVLLKWGNSYGAWTVSGGNLSGWMDLGTLWDSAALEQIGDFNGDGIDDLRVRITNGDLGAFCLGEGNLQWNYHFSVGSEWQTNLVSI